LVGLPRIACCPRLLAFPGSTGSPTIPGSVAATYPDGLHAASSKGFEAYGAAEILLKGPEAFLPDGRSFRDRQGHIRHEARLRWWDPNATTLRKAAFGMDGDERSLPDLPMTTEYLYTEQVPVFFGHYWLKGVPTLSSVRPRVLILVSQRKDFSRPIGGPERRFFCRTPLFTRVRSNPDRPIA
jgi:hypothetical protein